MRKIRSCTSLLLLSLVVACAPRAQAVTERLLYIFNKTDGAYPESSLIMDAAGNLYGTTYSGGDAQCDCGVVFELSPVANGPWHETVLYQFHGDDGSHPQASLVFDAKGNLYGTTVAGGNADGGVVFELSPSPQKTWTEKILYEFHGADGASPQAGLIFDAAGNLYGTTRSGGNDGCMGTCGVVFELMPASTGAWRERVLHKFQGPDGAWPFGALVFGKPGVLYGTTAIGCINGDLGCVFELKSGPNGQWTERVLFEFESNGGLGDYGPECALVLDRAGNLYGTTTFSSGSAFKLSRSNGQVIETEISNLSPGMWPFAGLTFDSHGNLYGTTTQGGSKGLCAESGCGIAFVLIPQKDGSWDQKVLHEFSDLNGDGAEPSAAVILDAAGNVYGTTPIGGPAGQFGYGVVFEITP